MKQSPFDPESAPATREEKVDLRLESVPQLDEDDEDIDMYKVNVFLWIEFNFNEPVMKALTKAREETLKLWIMAIVDSMKDEIVEEVERIVADPEAKALEKRTFQFIVARTMVQNQKNIHKEFQKGDQLKDLIPLDELTGGDFNIQVGEQDVKSVSDVNLSDHATMEQWQEMTDEVFTAIQAKQPKFEDKYFLSKYIFEMVERNGYFLSEQIREKYNQRMLKSGVI